MKPFSVLLALFGGSSFAAERKLNVLFIAMAGHRSSMASMVTFLIPISGLSQLLKGQALR